MKSPDLKKMTVPQLVERFTSLSLGQFKAELSGEIAKFNSLYDEVVAIKEELKSRAGDRRDSLVPLFAHANPQVRLNAAQWALAVSPVAARRTLQEISDRNEYPQAAYARQSLGALDRGESKLTE